MKKIVRFNLIPLMILGLLFFAMCEKGSNLPTDGDGNVYDTVVIGTQVWLKENLKTTKSRYGDPLHLVPENDKWGTYSFNAYCWYDNVEGLKDTYGALYNYKAVEVGAICPLGWHVPTPEDWTTLFNYLGGKNVAGKKLKETGFAHWGSENQGATNETGFTALAGGRRYGPGNLWESIIMVPGGFLIVV